VHSTLIIFTCWLPYRQRYYFIRLWALFMLWWSKFMCKLDYSVEGRENIPPNHPVILASTHESSWETFSLQMIFPVQCIVLKKELLRLPFFGWGLRFIKPIVVDRDDPANALKNLVEQGKDRLACGYWINIFPQGTRVPPGTEGKFTLGAAALAVETGSPILPVAHDAGDYWPRRHFMKRPGTIRVIIGPVIEPDGLNARQVHKRYKDWIMETRRRLTAEKGLPQPDEKAAP
jgi:1-acyl-sn-glycerol-3-phosphate acyltransferase